MGTAINSYKAGLGMQREQPKFVIAILAMTLLSSVLGVALMQVNAIIRFAVNFLFTPLFVTLTLGITLAVVKLDTVSLEAGVTCVKRNYLSVLGALLLMYAGIILVPIVIMAVPVIVGVAFVGVGLTGGVEGMMAASIGMILFYVVFFFIALVVETAAVLSLQFFDVAIVVGKQSAFSSLADGWQILRENPLSVVGYTFIRVVLLCFMVVPQMPYMYSTMNGASASTFALAIYGVGTVLITPIIASLLLGAHVTYYDALSGSAAN